jgi:hypothetical protein
LSEDPGRFPAGINFYRYVENDPVSLSDPSGFCPWQLHRRPLKGSFGGWGANHGIYHYYFYNVDTGQSIGLGPAGGFSTAAVLDRPVPGEWERNENPNQDVGSVKDPLCKCVDQKLKHPGNPPQYCTYHGNKNANPHPPCPNCFGWAVSILKGCADQQAGASQ